MKGALQGQPVGPSEQRACNTATRRGRPNNILSILYPMHPISIHHSIKDQLPGLRLACLSCSVKYSADTPALTELIQERASELSDLLNPEKIKELPALLAARKAYKTLGKDPSRYRLSAEALLRRIVQGKGLYEINAIVDSLNLVSAESGFSIGGYDMDAIEGGIELGIGATDEPYSAIGRGSLNIANLPILRDEKGAFGSPTSDSTRTMVNDKTQRFLMVFFDFGSTESIAEVLEASKSYLTTYCGASNIVQWFID